MKLEKIKDTATWKWLARNPKFEEEFEKAIKKCCYHAKPENLNIEVSDQKIRLSVDSGINNRDLDSQFKMFSGFEFALDDDSNLIVNELSGRLESNYGYDFNSTSGGKLTTYYSCWSYDEDGIELSYQSYVDKYLLDDKTFAKYQNNLQTVINGMYNPGLLDVADKLDAYPMPKVTGTDGRFIRKNRPKDNLGIVEVFKYNLEKDNSISSNKEYYFNTFFDERLYTSPELIHIMNGFPFAIVKEKDLRIKDDYAKLGLDGTNYQDVARERFLKELKEAKESQIVQNNNILNKYDMMIKKIEKELGIDNKKI